VVNGDSQIALADLESRLRAMLPEEYQDCYDDVQPVSMGSAGLKYDRDGRVGLADFATFSEDFLTHPATLRSDFDLGESVGLGDFAIFAEQFAQGQTAQTLCP